MKNSWENEIQKMSNKMDQINKMKNEVPLIKNKRKFKK